jgi:cellulose synthase/poly-beta-1,6-N-acetylglucosamine synthase-like glycosyltransferase
MWLFEFIVLIYFIYVVSYTTLFSIAGLFYKVPRFSVKKIEDFKKIAIFIPSYKEDGVIINVAKEALKQSFPKSSYEVIVIADSLQESTLKELKKLDIIVHEVYFEKSTKVKSLQSVLNTFIGYDIAVILDADNVMQSDFLKNINICFANGWKAIQGQRVAKNQNTPLAILDGLSEALGNHINRAGSIALGLSSPIIGSGMAYDFNLLKEIMNSIDSVGGFDKELQIRILERGEKILYLKNAIVLDEKVDTSEVFSNQRKRWISSHYIYAKKFLRIGLRSFFQGKFSLFNIAVLLSFQLPRVLNLGILFFLAILGISLHTYFYLPIWCWPVLFSIYIFSFALAVPTSFYNRQSLLALLHAPKAFITIFLLHFKLKGADKKFIHTPHKQQ